MTTIRPIVTASLHHSLRACIDQVAPLVYVGGSYSSAEDVPEHVRAASAVRRQGSRRS